MLLARVLRYRTIKFRPKLVSSFRPHGKWGDLIICIVPIFWCFNILVNSNFLLKLLEWQAESSLFTIRIRGKQWYWVYKFDFKNFTDILSTPKNIGNNKWLFSFFGELKTSDNYLHIIQSRSQNKWIKNYWSQNFNKFSDEKKNKYGLINEFTYLEEKVEKKENNNLFSNLDKYVGEDCNIDPDLFRKDYLNYEDCSKNLDIDESKVSDHGIYNNIPSSFGIVIGEELYMDPKLFAPNNEDYNDYQENSFIDELDFSGYCVDESFLENDFEINENCLKNINVYEFEFPDFHIEYSFFEKDFKIYEDCFKNLDINNIDEFELSDFCIDGSFFENNFEIYENCLKNLYEDEFELSFLFIDDIFFENSLENYEDFVKNIDMSEFEVLYFCIDTSFIKKNFEIYKDFLKNINMNGFVFSNFFVDISFFKKDFEIYEEYLNHLEIESYFLNKKYDFFGNKIYNLDFENNVEENVDNNIDINILDHSDIFFNKNNDFLKNYKNNNDLNFFKNIVFSNNEDNSRLSKNFLGKKKLIFLIKKDVKKINFSEKNFFFKFRFNDINSNFKNKYSSNSSYFTFKQKRYKRRTIVPKFLKNYKNVENKDLVFNGFLNLKSNYSIEENINNPTKYYRMLRKNRARSENMPVSISKRLLRVKRTLVIPTNINITAITNSYDVVHSWFIPGLGLKMDCVPGRSTHHTFYVDNAGFYYGQCAEICGRYHHHMPIRVCALPFEHFLIWWNTFGLPKIIFNKKGFRNIKSHSLKKFVW